MLTLPDAMIRLLVPFSVLFHPRTWAKVQVLLVGALLAPRKRTVTSAVRAMGLSDDTKFARYHHVLNRAAWSLRRVAQRMLLMLLQHFDDGKEPLVFGIDDTIERRWGARIKARGIYRDPVRSSRGHFVKASGLRWVCAMWLVPIPWAHRIWALPVLTALAPSERYYAKQGRPPKKVTDRARQLILQLRRWLPNRALVFVADTTYASLELLHWRQMLARPVAFITRLRLDAALYAPAPLRKPGQRGRPRHKGNRLPSLRQVLGSAGTLWTTVPVAWYNGTTRIVEIASETAVWYNGGKAPVPIRWVLIRDPSGAFEAQALLSTDLTIPPARIVEQFVQRWQLEVTFQEARAHLGIETQRQWSDLAIARTTPVLFGLFSWTTVAAHLLQKGEGVTARRAAWYTKSQPTFADAIALVRRSLWEATQTFSMSPSRNDMRKVSTHFLDRLVGSLIYAA
jgi:hypothetical protein